MISGMGGVGVATGPLIGGAITTAISWRAAFVFQALIILVIVILARAFVDPGASRPGPPVRFGGSCPVCCRLGGIGVGHPGRRQEPRVDGQWPGHWGAHTWPGSLPVIRRRERESREALSSTALLPQPDLQPDPRHAEHPVATADGYIVRRLRLPAGRQGLQRHPDGRDLHRRHAWYLAFLARSWPSSQAVRPADTHPRRLRDHPRGHRRPVGDWSERHPGRGTSHPGCSSSALASASCSPLSVNVVQSAFPEDMQGEISGLSAKRLQPRVVFRHCNCRDRSSSRALPSPNAAYGAAMVVLAAVGLVGLGATIALPATEPTQTSEPDG